MAELLSHPINRRKKLRELLNNAQPVLAPGCHDALSARLVEYCGFDTVYMGGFATTASILGRPDVGLLSGTEMIGHARTITEAVNIPVIADADTGYGNAINVIRTVREYEQAGVAAIHLEDQVSPKRCGHMLGKTVIPADEMVAKVRAAVAARNDPDFVLIARTDALVVEGMQKAIDRAKRYSDAGADLLFVESPTTEKELELIASQLKDRKVLLNWVEHGRTPQIPFSRIKELGFALVIFPIGSVLATMGGLLEHYKSLKEKGTPIDQLSKLPQFEEFTDMVGLPGILKLEQQYKSEG